MRRRRKVRNHSKRIAEVHGRVQGEGRRALQGGGARCRIRRDSQGAGLRRGLPVALGEDGRRRVARRSGHEPVPDAGGEPQAEARACQAQGGERDALKSQRLLREQAAVKEARFAFMDRHLDERGVSATCRAPGVARQGCYQWASRPDSAHDLRDRELARLIGDEHDASMSIYGAPKVVMRLRQKGCAHPASASPGSCASMAGGASPARAPSARTGARSASPRKLHMTTW